MRRIFLIGLIVIIFCVNGLPQSVSQLPSAEPFKISPGSSFSAGVPRNDSKNSGRAIGRSQNPIVQDFEEALEIIKNNHVSGDRLDYNQLAKNSITAMLRTLDPHSNYFDPVEFRGLMDDQNSEYYGIGATIINYQMGGTYDTFISSTFPGSPAFNAKLRFGDKIVSVNGENTAGKSASYVRDRVRGPKGSVVKLQIERPGSNSLLNIEIIRNRVPQPSIPDAYMLRPGIGYINLANGFNYTTLDELDAALAELNKNGAKSLVLDLRDNPGGIVEQAVRVAEKFLEKGQTVVSQRGRFKIDNRVWKSRNRAVETVPLVVLVNEGSASASEIVAGALQDYDRALIVGENTFGKGLVQSVLELPYGSGLTLTTARYFTPPGRSIQRDYSSGNLYDYYNHKNQTLSIKTAVTTASGRKVYGGNGITPDEKIEAEGISEIQFRLLDPVFFFSRELASGRIEGFENLKIAAQTDYGHRVLPGEFQISDALFERFKTYALEFGHPEISSDTVEANKQFIKLRMRYNLVVSAYGNVSGSQVLLEEDRQIAKAVESLPRAQQLARAARGLQLKK